MNPISSFITVLSLLLGCASSLGNNGRAALATRPAAAPILSSSFQPENKIENDNDPEEVTSLSQALVLKEQAKQLRAEAEQQAQALQIEREEKLKKEETKTDQWIEELFIQYSVDSNIQMLNSVDQVFELLKERRYSQEQVNKIFKRICETGPPQSRSKCSPIMTLLVDAVGKLDSVERQDNPNKRWNHRVERVLRKKLFARDFGIELEDEDDSENPWKLDS